jgi:hypothetical protein
MADSGTMQSVFVLQNLSRQQAPSCYAKAILANLLPCLGTDAVTTMSENEQQPLYLRSAEHDPENPFAGDLFSRRHLANKLTGLISRLAEGCVLAVDAPWGEGKTWFGKNWQSELDATGFPTVMIDAFRQDYADDPFLMICGEILAQIHDDDSAKGKLTEAGRKVAKALIPALAKATINFGGRVILGSADLSEDIRKAAEEIDNGVADAIEKRLAKRLDEYESDRRSVEGFASVLHEYAQQQDKPLVVIVDELDRCRPDFAVRTVERIKHFFDVPGVVFVLLVNRPQLEAAVKGVYGSDVDASGYLGKFVQFWLRLPKAQSVDGCSNDHNQVYCGELARRYGLNRKEGHRGFQEQFAAFATLSGLSLRDLERGYTLFSLAQPIDGAGSFAAWIIFLKLAHSDVHAGILQNSVSAHQKARQIISKLSSRSNEMWILPIIDDLHRFNAEGGSTPLNEDTKRVLQSIGTRSMQSERFLRWLCAKVDLTIEN